ncbi:30S ribosome-binding factor RbfA [Rickettsiella grylli]|uniref:Ribosome-binding factor A n=1 Tax=Rickettsiella grylli TaxID=59196 RepID=A8PNL0_9COXI|nr:30S ribosome-binding factor RbfA [Rickettsiella grylli]EDP46614.1 ribosome-binding factor A [Rickettsiella grylli]
MQKNSNRVARIADLIKKELSNHILNKEIADSRLKFITITSVKVSRDLSYADILFTQLSVENSDEKQKDKELAVQLVRKASARLRYALAQRLHLYKIPRLRFFYDDFLEESHRLHCLIEQAMTKDKSKRTE